ncbi:MAG TPA: D-alanyl-D-alanine carboxypeptidase family protein [Bauldia sp.]
MRFPAIITAIGLLVAGLPAIAAADPAYIVVDANTGAVLSDDQSAALWHPASVTKLMTAYVTFDAIKAGSLTMTSPVKISAHALAQAPAKMGFKVGTIVNVDNALKMMLVKSANDVAVAIAETVGGSEQNFVARMNSTARRLGMASTHYDNANGLPDDGQTTTARDLAVLARALITDFPEYKSYFGIPAIKAGKRVLRSENALLERYRGTTGMKTGFICASGYNIVATAHRGGRSLIAVVLGATSGAGRAEFTAHLLDEGFGGFPAVFAKKPLLTDFQSTPSVGEPADLHDLVCARHAGQKQETGDESADDTASALVPRFVLMDPVPVFTGRADTLPGSAPPTPKVASAAGKFPLPRLRPGAPPAAVSAGAVAVPVPDAGTAGAATPGQPTSPVDP